MSWIQKFIKREKLSETDRIKEEILELEGLCPSCKKSFKSGELIIKESFPYVYNIVVCNKCYKKDNFSIEKAMKNIDENPRVFSAILYEKSLDNDKSIVGKETEKMNALKPNSAWVLDDKSYFEDNPTKKYRIRKIFFGELEETFEHDSYLKDSAKNNYICFAIVHKINNEDRIISYVSDVSEHPIHDEKFIAAMFFYLMQDKINHAKKEEWKTKPAEEVIYEIYNEISSKTEFMEELEKMTTK